MMQEQSSAVHTSTVTLTRQQEAETTLAPPRGCPGLRLHLRELGGTPLQLLAILLAHSPVQPAGDFCTAAMCVDC